ncbi:MAG: hypothetical protein GXY58_19465 [Planctomycetaceae bacterium]|nr:hypothetical protein [Planctomycetaceae bacterium]
MINPSGDTSGEKDTRNLQRALAEGTSESCPGAVVLSGHYRINAGLVSGDPTHARRYGPSIIALGPVIIECVGTGWKPTDYALSVYGNTIGDRGGYSRAVVSGLKIQANNKCRGMLIARQFHFQGIEKIHIEQTVQVALDTCSCWKSFVRDVHILNCRGFAWRLNGGHDNMRIDNVRIGYCRGMWHRADDAHLHPPGGYAADSRALSLHEMKCGYNDTRKQYGDDYMESWPAADDGTLVLRRESDGTTYRVRTPEAYRACVLCDSANVAFDHVMFENCHYGSKPLVYIPHHRSRQISFTRLHVEACYQHDCIIHASSYPTSGGSGGMIFRDTDCVNDFTALDTEAHCRYFLRLARDDHGAACVSNVLVDGIRAIGLKGGIICCTGPGEYHRIRVCNARTRTPRSLLPHEWIATERGATLDDAVAYRTDTRDVVQIHSKESPWQ